MSEKRFRITTLPKSNAVAFDEKQKKHYIGIDFENLLNEQQATIQFLQNEIDELKKDIDIYKYEEKKHSETARKLYEENEQLKEELNNLKKDETRLYHYYTLARYGGD